jgi:WD40 repeat protein
VLSGGTDGTLKLWDVSTGREVRTFGSQGITSYSAAFSPDGRWALSGDVPEIGCWEVRTGERFASLYLFMDGGWAIISRDGRYDASNDGVVEELHWVEGDKVIPLTRENREG